VDECKPLKAGSGRATTAAGTGTAAASCRPFGIAIAPDGSFIVTQASHRIRKMVPGKAVQVDPIKPTLTAPVTKRLTLKHATAFKFWFQIQLAPLQPGPAVPQGPGPPPPQVTYIEQMKCKLGDPTFSDVAFVVEHVDDQAARVLITRTESSLNPLPLFRAYISAFTMKWTTRQRGYS